MGYILSDLRTKIKTFLGSGYVTVELTDSQIDLAIEQALGEYNQKVGSKLYKHLSVNAAQSMYDISDFVTNYKVQEIIKIQSLSPGSEVNIYNSMYENSGIPFSHVNDIGFSFYSYRQAIQNLEVLFDAVVDFNYDRVNKQLYLKVPRSLQKVVLVCICNVGLENIQDEYNTLFFSGCLGYAKQTLGFIRRKYDGAELPGASVNLDGKEFVTEGKADIEEYQKKLTKLQGPTIIVG